MIKHIFLSTFFLFFIFKIAFSQILYVDPINGNDGYQGSDVHPYQSLNKAICRAQQFVGSNSVHIKLKEGLYLLENIVKIRSANNKKFIIEAMTMPDDKDWQPNKMPIIASISKNNSVEQFPHCVGLLASSGNITIRGLKFLGNANPVVDYYYPITREDTSLIGLEVSQCYFIGEKNSMPIQSGIWAHGVGIHVSHCIFYGCKNALVLIKSIKDFSMTNSIVSGAYEAAVWFGPMLGPFTFTNNIITNCNFFWVRGENTYPKYTFRNSIISSNSNYMGFFTSHDKLIPADKSNLNEPGIRKKASLSFVQVKAEGVPKNYLNLSLDSDGQELKAGIFRR